MSASGRPKGKYRKAQPEAAAVNCLGKRGMRARACGGGLMIELLVALVICAFGLLGFVGLQARATGIEFESYQRSQALVLLDDISARINANRAAAAAYVSADPLGGGPLQDCAGLSGANLDLCEWSNLLRGASESRAGRQMGAMLGARGCIGLAAGTTDRYQIGVAWLGTQATGGSVAPCGRGNAAFPDEALRRAITATLCVGRLRDPAIAPATQRC